MLVGNQPNFFKSMSDIQCCKHYLYIGIINSNIYIFKSLSQPTD